MPSIPL